MRLVWRHSPRRLDAEEIRDATLAAAGTLDPNRPEASPAKDLKVVELSDNGPETAFLPAHFQGTRINDAGYLPDLKAQMPASLQRRQLDLIQEMNRDLAATPGAPEQVEGVIQSYELAFRMEGKVAELLDISKEPQKVRDASGAVRQRVRPAADRQGPDGRDHNVTGYPMWLAGAGVKKGFSYGATDEYGVHAVEGRMHTTDLHATLLALLGLDHEKLTYRYAGRSFRLTDVAGNVVEEIMA